MIKNTHANGRRLRCNKKQK